jgi:hypothetical protein
MDMSTPSTAQSLDGAVDASVVRETNVVVGDGHERDHLGERDIGASLESTNEVPMQFVRLGLPATIFLWAVLALVVYIAYRLLAG